MIDATFCGVLATFGSRISIDTSGVGAFRKGIPLCDQSFKSTAIFGNPTKSSHTESLGMLTLPSRCRRSKIDARLLCRSFRQPSPHLSVDHLLQSLEALRMKRFKVAVAGALEMPPECSSLSARKCLRGFDECTSPVKHRLKVTRRRRGRRLEQRSNASASHVYNRAATAHQRSNDSFACLHRFLIAAAFNESPGMRFVPFKHPVMATEDIEEDLQGFLKAREELGWRELLT